MSRYKIETWAVIGAGNMGSGIAQKVATEGHRVILVDVDDEKVERGLRIIRETLAEGVARGIFTPARVEEILGRVKGTSDCECLGQADLVVEAVFEDLEVKREVFGWLSEKCREDAILATNTSSFYVRDVAAACSHPERVIGLHYFYHPAKNRLVEVVGHEGTDAAALRAAWSAQEAIGKTPIASADAPGFVVNRFFVPWLNEAVRLLAEGVASIATIDAAAKAAFEIGMGPFELMNVTGVPIALHAATTLGQNLHEFYVPDPRLAAQVSAGVDWDLSGEPEPAHFEVVADRLRGVVFLVASSLVSEQVGSVEDTEIGARVGLRWSKGPFQLVNEVGPETAAALASSVGGPHGLGVPPLLAEASPSGIDIRLVSTGQRGPLTSLSIERPDALNALNETVVGQLDAAIDSVRGDGRPGLVICGVGKAFVAGADIKFFVDRLDAGDFPSIHEFTRQGQVVLARLAQLDRPVVARLHGLSLGGGTELALACDWIVASPKGSFGFPETGLGIFPGLGGTQRLPRRVGLPIAKYLVYSGQVLGAAQAKRIGLCDEVVPFAELDRACAARAEMGKPGVRHIPTSPQDPSWEPVWSFFATHTVDQVLSGEAQSTDPVVAKAVKRIRHKSPAALRLAERLLELAAVTSLADGLQAELDHLEQAFGHPDAYEGLSALIGGRRPVWP